MRIFLTGSQPIEKPFGSKGKAFNLIQLLIKAGYSVSDSPDSDVLFAIDHNPADYKRFLKNGGSRERSFLLRLEPECVYPLQYKPKIEEKYIGIYSPGRKDKTLSDENFLPWCYRIDDDPLSPIMNDKDLSRDTFFHDRTNGEIFEIWKQRPHNLTMITSNKISADEKSNYAIRRAFAHELSNDGLMVYGNLWNVSLLKQLRYRLALLVFFLKCRMWFPIGKIGEDFTLKIDNYFGMPSNKHEILRQSKFSIVIENSNTYISEKLFDCLINGAIPFYIGPDLSQYGIPVDIAIQGTITSQQIRNKIQKLNDDEIASMLQATQNFLKSDNFQFFWNEEYVFKKVIQQMSAVLSASNFESLR